MPTRHILVADNPESFAVLQAAVTSTFVLKRVSTVEEAKLELADPPSVVICGCHFDEGRMYDLLRHLKATPALKNLPFVAVRCVQGELLEDALYESVKIAVRALGGNSFVDLLRWQRRWGVAEASHRLTQLLETLAAAPPADTDR